MVLNMKYIFISLLAVIVFLLAVTAPVLAESDILFPECRDNGAGVDPSRPTEFCDIVNDNTQPIVGDNSLTENVVNTIVFISGTAAVIMIVIGGLRYALSSGDPQGTASAKNTIIYAIVGFIIAVAARSIVLFVVDRI